MGVVRRGFGGSSSSPDSRLGSEGAQIPTLDPTLPIDVRFLSVSPGGETGVRGQDLFELAYISAGTGEVLIQERRLPARRGDLLVIGKSLDHRLHNRAVSPLALECLYFHPDLIRGDSGEEGAEYLTPFLWQDAGFPPLGASSNMYRTGK